MGLRINSPSQTTDNTYSQRRQLTGDLFGYIFSIQGTAARTHHGDSRKPQYGKIAKTIEHQRWVEDLLQLVWVLVIENGQDPDPLLLGLPNDLFSCSKGTSAGDVDSGFLRDWKPGQLSRRKPEHIGR